MAATEISTNSKSSSSVKKAMTIEEQVQKNKRDFLKIMAATLKYQNPEKPADTSQVAQTMAIIHQTEETGKMRASIDKLKEALTANKLAKVMPFQGKVVKYDTSVKEFDGSKPVEFMYQLKFDDQSRPNGTHVSTILSIYDTKGVKIFQTRGKSEKGVHSFLWDGYEDGGYKASEGKYRIKVESYFEGTVDGNYVKIPIEAGAFVSGFVDSVEMQDDRVVLSIGGKYIDPDDIIKVESEKQEEIKPQLSEYASYIGKEAVLNNNQLEVNKDGMASFEYKCNIDRPGKLMVKIFDQQDQFVGMTICSGIRTGLNNISFKASKALTQTQFDKFESGSSDISLLNQGEYKYKLSIQDKLAQDPERFIEIPTERVVTVTGLDFSDEPYILAGDEKFQLSSITRLTNSHTIENIHDKGVHYIGRPAIVNLNTMTIKRGQVEEVQYVSIPAPEDGSHYGKVYMRIFDSAGKFVADVGTKIFVSDNYSMQIKDDELLKYIRDQDIIGLKAERAITIPENDYESITSYIKSLNRDGLLESIISEVKDRISSQEYKIDYSKLEKSKALEAGVDLSSLSARERVIFNEMVVNKVNSTPFIWDCTDASGKSVPAGDYRYEFIAEKYHGEGSSTDVLELVKIEDKAKFVITEYKMELGQMKLLGRLLSSDNSLSSTLTEFNLDQVLSLEA